MSVNLNRNVDDAFYRYKMPPITAKVEGKGNGIKTVIVNMVEIAKALGRSPEYSTKYFGCELGAQTQIDTKNERYIVNGEHEAKRLQDLLDGFIKKFVLCGKCGNPETNMVIKSEKISLQCIACGNVTAVDMRHKLTTFILKNPPADSHKSAAPKDLKKEKKEKRAKKAAEAGEQEAEEAAEPAQRTRSEANDDDDFGDDATEEAARARALAQLSAGIASLTVTDDLERSSSDRLDLFRSFVVANTGDSKFGSKVVAEAERLDCKEKGIMVLVDTLLNSDTEFVSRAKTYAALILRFVSGNAKAQKYFIHALELLTVTHPKLVDKFAALLKSLYDLDLLEEEGIYAWAEKVSKKYVSKEHATKLHEKAAPFIAWLREAEEESSEEEEDEDEVEVTFGSGANQAEDDDDDDDAAEEAPAPVYQHTRGLTVPKAAAVADDDIDIDAI